MNKPYVGEEIDATILDYTKEGSGVARVNSYPIFVPLTVVGDKVKIKVTKDKKSYFEAELVEVIESSPNRIEPSCKYFGICGGCDFLHIDYDSQIEAKRKTIQNAISKITKDDIKVNEVIKSENPFYYRNKATFNFGLVDGKIKASFYKKKSYDVLDIDECKIVRRELNDVRFIIEQFCNEYMFMPKKLVTKVSDATEEIMVSLIVNEKNFSLKNELIEKLKTVPNVKSIIINYADNEKQVGFGKKSELIFGDDFITEEINGLKFKNYLKSFFQVNPNQTKKLYAKAIEFMDLKEDDSVIDIYSGVGTISLLLADKVLSVAGVEIVEDAVKSAKENAKNNNIKNATFILSDADNLSKIIKKENDKNYKIIVDPPRKGLTNKVISGVLDFNASSITYISCNEGTMARDLKVFKDNGYTLEKIVGVDMFSGSHHVECVCLITKSS